MKDRETKEKFIELRASGYSYDRIAEELHLSKQTLINWSKDLRLQLENRKTIAMDALCEKYFLHKHHRISLFGDQLDKVRAELSKRDMSDIPTEKLVDMLVKLSSILKVEQGDLAFQKEEDVPDLSLSYTSSWPAN